MTHEDKGFRGFDEWKALALQCERTHAVGPMNVPCAECIGAEIAELRSQAHLYHKDAMIVRDRRDQALAREAESNREFWRVTAERDEAHAETKRWAETAGRKSARLLEAESRADWLQAALQRFADQGIHADPTPARRHPIGETASEVEAFYQSYLERADKLVKGIARSAIAEDGRPCDLCGDAGGLPAEGDLGAKGCVVDCPKCKSAPAHVAVKP